MRYLPLLVSAILINAGQVLAIPARTIYSQDVQTNAVDLRVWKGYGITINFIPTGETIKQVWIGDPSRIGFTSNGNLCPKQDAASQDCNGGATVLFLRQIKPINFPNLTTARDNSTQITILTSGAGGEKQYQFKLIMASGEPQYTSLIIKPDSEKPVPLLLRKETPAPKPVAPQNNESVDSDSVAIEIPVAEPVKPTISRKRIMPVTKRDDPNSIIYGLTIARRNGQIKPNSAAWRQVQNAIIFLRQGKTTEQAVTLAGVSLEFFNQLIELGAAR